MKEGFEKTLEVSSVREKDIEKVIIKTRVFNFQMQKDVEEYFKLMNDTKRVTFLEEYKDFDRNGVFRLAVKWAETEETGISIIGSEVYTTKE